MNGLVPVAIGEIDNVTALSGRSASHPSRVPIDYYSARAAAPDAFVEHEEQGEPTDNRSRYIGRKWVTSPEGDWLNGLCLAYKDRLPPLEGIPESVEKHLREVFRDAFLRTRDDLNNLEFKAPLALRAYEHLAWMVIRRKTLDFGKFSERLPRRVFLRGEEQTDTYRGIAPCGVGNQHLDKALRGAIATGWASRHASAVGDESHVYLPLAAGRLIQKFFHHAYVIAGRHGTEPRNAVDRYRKETVRRCADILTPPEGASPAPALTKKDATAARNAFAIVRCRPTRPPVQPITVRRRTRPVPLTASITSE